MASANREARANGELTELGPREWTGMEYLLINAPKPASKDKLLQAMTGWDKEIIPNAIEAYISRLRSKLEPHGIALRSIRYIGYRLEMLRAAQTAGLNDPGGHEVGLAAPFAAALKLPGFIKPNLCWAMRMMANQVKNLARRVFGSGSSFSRKTRILPTEKRHRPVRESFAHDLSCLTQSYFSNPLCLT